MQRSPGPLDPALVEEQRATIYVGNLAPDTHERSLQEFFGPWGPVKSTKVVIDHETGRSKGFGFVTFHNHRDAADAVGAARGKILDGAIIRVNPAKYPKGGGPPPSRGIPAAPLHPRGRDPYDRSRSRSRGRYSPTDRYSPGGRSYADGYDSYGSGGRSHSYTPPPRRRGAKRGRSPSRSGSYDSFSSGGSYSSGASRSPKARPAPPRGPAPPAAALQSTAAGGVAGREVGAGPPPAPAPAAAELQASLDGALQREGELQARVAALEAQASGQAGGQGELQQQVVGLEHRLQKTEDTVEHYRTWLTAVTEVGRALAEGRAQLDAKQREIAEKQSELTAREGDLSEVLESAGQFMAKERARAAKRAKRHAQRSQGENGVPAGEAGDQAAGDAAGASDQAKPFTMAGVKFKLGA